MISGLSAYNRGDYIKAFRTPDFCGAVSSGEPFFKTTIESRGAVNGAAAGVSASPVPVTEEELGDVAAACDPRPPIEATRSRAKKAGEGHRLSDFQGEATPPFNGASAKLEA
jgi:hypothetical protein